LIRDNDLAESIGAAGHESVLRQFLLPRLALDYLKVAKQHAS
jgi:hypothetical protein